MFGFPRGEGASLKPSSRFSKFLTKILHQTLQVHPMRFCLALENNAHPLINFKKYVQEFYFHNVSKKNL